MWSWSWRAQEQLLVEESEAFLRGTLAPALAAREGRVPAWARLNRLAHGNEASITALAATSGVDRGEHGVEALWHTAEAYLAQELLTHCGCHTLGDLQHEVLQPLELRVACAGTPWTTPIELVQEVLGALDAAEHRWARRRSAS